MKYVTAEGFWRMMCKPGFVRTSAHFGYRAGRIYYTMCPPEQLPGFMGGALQHAITRLEGRRRG